MGVDEALLASAQRSGVASLRFYTWSGPWLSLGYAQRLSPSQREACRREGVGCVRRVTGGRAVLHGADLTYSLAAPIGLLPDGLEGSYLRVAEALCAALVSLGVPVTRGRWSPRGGRSREFDCFAGAASVDLCIGGRKLSGSAQRRAAGALLQHGSIRLVDDAPAVVEAALPAGEHQRATSLAGQGHAISPDELRRACCEALAAALRVRFEEAALEPGELHQARARGQEPAASDLGSGLQQGAAELANARHP